MHRRNCPITLEVCVDSLASAKTAASCGAQRIELNTALELGGLTPSIGLVEEVMLALKPMKCEVIVMVRPRLGGFAYDRDELIVMQRDIDRMLEAGVDGIALGVLRSNGSIDVDVTQTLIQPVLNAKRQAVFHRAFDLTPDAAEALNTLISLGFHRVLTSGQATTAHQGAAVIRELIAHADGRIQVLPGSGITADSVDQLIRETGCDQIHASLRQVIEDHSGAHRPAIGFDSPPPSEGGFHRADPQKVTAMLRAMEDQNEDASISRNAP